MQPDLLTCVSLSLCVWDRGQRHHDNAQLFPQKGTRRRCANVGRLVQMISAFSRSRCCVCVCLDSENPAGGKNDVSVGRVQRIQLVRVILCLWICV